MKKAYYKILWTFTFGSEKVTLDNGKNIRPANMHLDYVERGRKDTDTLIEYPESYVLNLRHDLLGAAHISQHEENKHFLPIICPSDLEIIKTLDDVSPCIWENIVRFQMGMFGYKIPENGEFAARNLHNKRKREKLGMQWQ